MIYTNDFIWLHFPKCAGTKVENIFRKYFSDYVEYQDDITKKDGHWHDNIAQRKRRDRSFDSEGRQIIVCVRRLPEWLISRYNFEFRRSPELAHDVEALIRGQFFEVTGVRSHADDYINQYLGNQEGWNKLAYVRVENFEEDFKKVFGRFVDITRIPDFEWQVKENRSFSAVDEKTLAWFYSKSEEIYGNCPKWSRMEELVYYNDK